MTSLGRLIFFDQPGTGASDPVEPGAMPTLEQWADSITAVLDAIGSPGAALVTWPGAFPTAALFAATYPSRTTALVVLEGWAVPYAEQTNEDGPIAEEISAAMVAVWGTGEFEHVLNPDMPWNEEIRATWARHERLSASPRTVGLLFPLFLELDVRPVLPTIRVPTLVLHHPDNQFVPARTPRYIADRIPGANYVELPGRNVYHFVEPWRESFQKIAQFLTGEQPDVVDDRVLATVLFTDIVDSTRRAAEMGDRDWRALLDAHDAVVRSQLARFRGREVSTAGDGFLAMFDGPQRAIRCAMAIRCGAGARHRGARRFTHRRMRGPRRRHRRNRCAHRRASERTGRGEGGAGVQHAARLGDRVRARVRGARRSRAQGRARPVATLRRRLSVAVDFGQTHVARRNGLCTR